MFTLKRGDLILCDLPYGTTACAWDSVIPFGPLWEQYERVLSIVKSGYPSKAVQKINGV